MKRVVAYLLGLVLAPMWVQAGVVSHTMPAERYRSLDYVVEVDGVEVPVYRALSQHHDKKYSIAYFDMEGSVEVVVKSSFPLSNLQILPAAKAIEPQVSGEVARFRLQEPMDLSFEPDGCNSPLLLFANAPETFRPDPADPQVLYFGPGEHNPEGGLIRLSDNQTLYLATGAVVNAGIEASGDNITICGRGILDGSDWHHNAGPTDFMVNAKNCNNLVMRDIIIKGSYYWTIVPQGCDRVLVDHVRLAGSRVGNDDGCNPCNSSNVTIRNCFFRTDDDSISPKGITRADGVTTSKPTENIVVENCVFWVDFANVFRIATESSCPAMRNITARNIDVIHFPNRDRVQIFWLHPTGEMPMENLSFEQIRIHGERPYNLIKITPALQLVGTRPMVVPTPNNITRGPGRRGIGSRGYGEFVVIPSYGPYVHNVTFRDIETYDYGTERGLGRVVMMGVDAEHNVANITLERVSYFGVPVDTNYSSMVRNEFVEQIKIKK